MQLFNTLYKSIIETTLTDVFGNRGEYNPGDNRPIVPSDIILGTKRVKKRNNKKTQIQRRTLY